MEQREIITYGGYFERFFNGFQKKSQKTPKKEIDKAENIRREYFNNQLN